MHELKQLWREYQGTPRDAKLGASAWINEALNMFESDARSMQAVRFHLFFTTSTWNVAQIDLVEVLLRVFRFCASIAKAEV